MNLCFILHLMYLKEVDKKKAMHLDFWLISKAVMVNPMEKLHKSRNEKFMQFI